MKYDIDKTMSVFCQKFHSRFGQVTRDKNFLLERLMKYEGVTSESDSDDEKLNEDKSRQGFSPAPPSFKRPNVLAVTPGHTPASITMPSPRGIMMQV